MSTGNRQRVSAFSSARPVSTEKERRGYLPPSPIRGFASTIAGVWVIAPPVKGKTNFHTGGGYQEGYQMVVHVGLHRRPREHVSAEFQSHLHFHPHGETGEVGCRRIAQQMSDKDIFDGHRRYRLQHRKKIFLQKWDPPDYVQVVEENYANPKTCFFHVLFKSAALAFYILSALFVSNFVIIFVITVFLSALDFWVVKNVSGRILVGLRWWNEINEQGESVWKFESLDQESLARINKKDSWLFWWTLYLTAVAWVFLGIFSLIRFQADYVLAIGVCLSLSIANIVGFTKCRKDAKKQLQAFASKTIASRVSSTLQSAFSIV